MTAKTIPNVSICTLGLTSQVIHQKFHLILKDLTFYRPVLLVRKHGIINCMLKWSNFVFQAAKDVVLAEKPVITDDSNQLDPTLLDELLANIATLSSVYHKPPEAFVTRLKTTSQKTEDDDYAEGEAGISESPAHAANNVVSSPPSSSSAPTAAARQPVSASNSPAPAAAPVPDLLGDLIGLDNNAIVPVDEPATPSG